MTDQIILGVDTGGTFTDFVLCQHGSLQLHKVLSTPEAPEKAILQGMAELGLDPALESLRIVHGTTVATNAALEKKGAKTVFITNRGFGDTLTIGRQARKELYNLTPVPTEPPVQKEYCLETGGRRSASGELISPLTEADINQLLATIDKLKPSAAAISLLFSFLDDSEERRIQRAIEQKFGDSLFVCRSSSVLPELKEYERGLATWYNAYLGPLVKAYLTDLHQRVAPTPLAIMQSTGSTISAQQAALRPVNLLLSGPAGGLAAVEHIGKQIGEPKLLSFDMGGTSTDVALVDGTIKLTTEGKIGGLPISVPMVDMHTIGAGGGSIAYLDDSRMLHVGPESAGAKPGPACYGQGGIQPTVTDANATLGRLQPDNFLGGRMTLRQDLAEQAVTELATKIGLTQAEAAQGVLDLADEHMLQALRLISEQRGQDPKDFVLCGFGGAGGLHICALAEALGIERALIPNMGGVLSALGMLVAVPGRELSKANLCLLQDTTANELESKFRELEAEALAELEAEGHDPDKIQIKPSIDCRYQGQSFFLNIAWHNLDSLSSDFHLAHAQAYGHQFELPIELVNLRISASLKQNVRLLQPEESSQQIATPEHQHRDIWVKEKTGQLRQTKVPLVDRTTLVKDQKLTGPALICEEASTTWVAKGWEFYADSFGNLRINRAKTEL